MISDLFTKGIKEADPEVYGTLSRELERQQNQIELIASENIASRSILNAQGSVMTNKYAEGYPGKRYYGGCEFVDQAEEIALERVKKLFNCKFANLQPHSGAQANQAVFVKKDGNDKDLIDYDEVEALALEHKPKMIIAGASAYPRTIDWKKFREIADKVGAYFLVDMAHYSGLVAGKQYPNPIEHAHVVTSTTHKTLRGARSAMILTNHEDLYKKINSAVFPGLQGGPLMHVIAARAVCFGEALKPEFEEYIKNVIASAKVMAKTLVDRGFRIVTGGTDSHIVWLDLTPKGLTGDKAEKILEEVGLACNKNAIPYDPNPPKITSGLRFGTAAATTRGFNQKDFEQVGNMIADILDSLLLEENERNVVFNKTRKDVIELCKKYPIYSEAF